MSLRVKFVNSKLEFKTCYKCNKTYPRDEDHFYKMKHPDTEMFYLIQIYPHQNHLI